MKKAYPKAKCVSENNFKIDYACFLVKNAYPS
jgi:hypothetical protein